MSDGRYFLHRYYNLVNRHRKPLRCRFCSQKFSARELESHFFERHRYRFPNLHSCPWCVGNVFWKPRKKNRYGRHLSDCFKRYGKQFEWAEPEECFDDLKPVCGAREWYGRWMLFDLHPYAYESVYLPVANDDEGVSWWRLNEENTRRLRFIDDLGLSYVRKFLQFEGSTVGWFHLIVRAHALGEFFERFEEYVDPENDSKRHRAFLLEFSCWCDGGERYEDPTRRHHRHMIAVARNGKEFYDQCWKKVVVEEKPPVSDYRYKLCYDIRSWRRLKDTLFHVSSRNSKKCDFVERFAVEKEPCDRETFAGSCHFYVFRPVTPRFELRAALDGVEGIREAITSLRERKPVTPFALKCDRGPGSAWRVKIGDVIDPHTERSVEREGREMHGVRRGKEFLESAKNDWWYPPRNQQRILDEVVPLVREIESLRFECARHYRNNERNYRLRLNTEKQRLGQQESELERQKRDFEKLRDNYDKLTDAFLKSVDETSKIITHILFDEIRQNREEIRCLREESAQQRDMLVQLTNRSEEEKNPR